jgi:hypothetical protein
VTTESLFLYVFGSHQEAALPRRKAAHVSIQAESDVLRRGELSVAAMWYASPA